MATARPATGSVEVTLERDGTLADAMSKAAFVLGPKDGIALITLDRPDVLNAMNTQMRTELLEIFTRLRTDDGINGFLVEKGMKIGYVTDYVGRTILEARAPAAGVEPGEPGRRNRCELRHARAGVGTGGDP